MTQLDNKINEHFAGLVVRKDLVKAVKGNAIVPSYVLEYLLGQYCATDDEATIQTGIETVREILQMHYVHRNEAGLIRSNIRERGRYKVIDKVAVALNDTTDAYEAEFSNLGIKKVVVASSTIKKHPKLLVGGVWCIAEVGYEFVDDQDGVPWILSDLKPIQLSDLDFNAYVSARREFTTDEWIDLLLQSVGLNPEMFGRRTKLLQLARLIPFCERNYNLLELGPKGTGKSHIYSEFSPHGILISGGEVTVPKLFVNNATGKIGLVGYWDCVAFDEFAGKQKRVDKALVDVLKNYMANKSFSRGIETLGAEASMVFVGNTKHTVAHMLRHSDLFEELPDKFYDSAFLDRVHLYLPGWEIDIMRGESFSDGFGFVVDYLAEVLRSMRDSDFSDRYQAHFSLGPEISTRDRDGINKTFSGMMKVLYPEGTATADEVEEILQFAIEGRKRVKDQLMRIDATYAAVDFAYESHSGSRRSVATLEQREYPDIYHHDGSYDGASGPPNAVEFSGELETPEIHQPAEGHRVFVENQRGVSFDDVFGPYLAGATEITITDPYVRVFHQVRNLIELCETIVRHCGVDGQVVVRLITSEDEERGEQQQLYLENLVESAAQIGLDFSFEFAPSNSIHARHVVTDTGWKILLDRGLDVFQRYEMNDAFSFANRLQQFRSVRAFEVTYLRAGA